MTVSLPLQTRELFGGALTMGLPVNYLDASDLRQIPDNQEVFLSPDSDTSVIIELLSLVTEDGAKDDLWAAAKFHFASVAHDNASLSSTILTAPPAAGSIPSVPQVAASAAGLSTPAPVVLVGTQRIHKFSHDPTGAPRPGHESDVADDVWIGLALWRVDVVVGGNKKTADVVCTANVRASAAGGADEVAKTQQWLEAAVKDFKIVDWNLFADE